MRQSAAPTRVLSEADDKIASNLRSAPNEDLENDYGVDSWEQSLMPKNSQSDNLLSLGLLPTVTHNAEHF
jgi:hypothetical protein